MARSRAGKLSLRHSYPESGPKPTTYDAWGAAARRYQPGGLAGAESSFIIGGSYYEHGGIPSYRLLNPSYGYFVPDLYCTY